MSDTELDRILPREMACDVHETMDDCLVKEAKAAINKEILKARRQELVITCLGGMGGLTANQQTYITRRLEELTKEIEA